MHADKSGINTFPMHCLLDVRDLPFVSDEGRVSQLECQFLGAVHGRPVNESMLDCHINDFQHDL